MSIWTIETTDPIGSWVEARSSHKTKQTKNNTYTRADERQRQRQQQQQFCPQCPILSGIEPMSDHSSPSSLTVKILYMLHWCSSSSSITMMATISTQNRHNHISMCVFVCIPDVFRHICTYIYHYVKRTRAMQCGAASSSRTACGWLCWAMLLCTHNLYIFDEPLPMHLLIYYVSSSMYRLC